MIDNFNRYVLVCFAVAVFSMDVTVQRTDGQDDNQLMDPAIQAYVLLSFVFI